MRGPFDWTMNGAWIFDVLDLKTSCRAFCSSFISTPLQFESDASPLHHQLVTGAPTHTANCVFTT
jgi:hypothetical protein